MKSILKVEMHRAFRSSGFFLALGVGVAIAVVHCAMTALPLALQMDEYMAYNLPMMYPGFLYTAWIGGSVNTVTSYLYFLILPLLAALPHADSFFADAEGGTIQNLCLRVNRKHYFRAKYAATFLSGGMAVILPLLFNFYLTSLLLPAMKPETAAFNSGIGEFSLLPGLFYSHPLIYLGVFFCIIFLFSGLLATVSLLASYYVRYRFLVMIAPFIVYLFLISFFDLLGMRAWEPANFLHPAYDQYALVPLITETVVLAGLTVCGFLIRGAKDDIY